MNLLYIGIPSIHGRELSLAKLLQSLGQVPDWAKVYPWTTNHVSDGGLSIAEKRSILLQEALRQGYEYTVQIDDDDIVAPGYFEFILAMAEMGKNHLQRYPDCLAHDILVKCKGQPDCLAQVSYRNKGWRYLEKPNNRRYAYFQAPYYKVPIRTELAIQASPTEPMRFGEDFDFAQKLQEKKLIKAEMYKPVAAYIYHMPEKHDPSRYGI